MLTRMVAATTLAVLALGPVALSAQTNVRGSGQQNYHLVQLTVSAKDVALEDFKARTQAISSCSQAKDVAREVGADIKRNRFVMAHQLPAAVKTALEATDTGSATEVFSSDGDTLRVLVLCNRA